jgi:plastin-3
VNWKRVVVKFRKLQSMLEYIQNCNYAVELGKQMNFSLVGIQGKDLYDGNQTLTLGIHSVFARLNSVFSALVWQLMRAYTLTILAQCTQTGDRLATDREIIQWVNEKLESSGKHSRIKSFQDPSIMNARPVIDLIDAIKPGTINYDLVQSHDNPEVRS